MSPKHFDLLLTEATLAGFGYGQAGFVRGAIGICGSRIAYVGEVPPPGATATRVLELPRHLICPGFVNMHYHAGLNFARGVAPEFGFAPSYTPGLPLASSLSANEAAALSRLGALEALKAGCTTLVDSFVHADAIVPGMAALGGRLFVSPRLNDVDFASLPSGKRRFDAALARLMLAEAQAFYSRWHGQADGRVHVHLAAHAPDTCSPEFIGEIAAFGRQYDLRISTHLAQSRDEVDWVRARYACSPVAWLERMGLLGPKLLAAHCIHLDEDDILMLAASGTHVIHIPLGNAISGRIAPTDALRRHGAALCLATDTMHGDMIEAMRWALALGRIQHGGLGENWRAPQLLAMATQSGATALGVETSLGGIELGQQADLAIIDTGSPALTPCIDPLGTLVHNGTAADVVHVVVDGRLVVENRRSTLADEHEIIAHADEAARSVWARCPESRRRAPHLKQDISR